MTTHSTTPERALDRLEQACGAVTLRPLRGRVTGASGTIIRAVMRGVTIGEMCSLHDQTSGLRRNAEVVGLDGEQVLLTPIGPLEGIGAGMEVIGSGMKRRIPVGMHLLGRVIDALGLPLDNGPPLPAFPCRTVQGDPPAPMERASMNKPLSSGVRAIDGLLTCAEGQRIGIYGEAGGGKSTLMSQIVRGSAADVAVVALVGERGREVREFIEHSLGAEGLKHSVVVVATSDRPAAERVACAEAATAIAEHFRDMGKKVLLFVDNVTRYARALREIGLAAGEPPTRRGFTPSVFTALPRLMERAGMGKQGSITAFYAVLVEDGGGDPIAEETRGILDGHIMLTRALAATGHYPAIDVTISRSRVMNQIVNREHRLRADRVRALVAKYSEVSFLLQLGEYKAGGDKQADEAIALHDKIEAFLCQTTDEKISYEETESLLCSLIPTV